jgi:hypothetical protein
MNLSQKLFSNPLVNKLLKANLEGFDPSRFTFAIVVEFHFPKEIALKFLKCNSL